MCKLVVADDCSPPPSEKRVATTIKRQKSPSKKAGQRSRSTPVRYRSVGRGSININEDDSEAVAAEKIDKYWEPPPLGSRPVKKPSPAAPPLPSTSPEERQLSEAQDGMQKNRGASLYLSPEPSVSSQNENTPELDDATTTRSPSRAPGTPESVPQREIRTSRSTGELNIDGLSIEDHFKAGDEGNRYRFPTLSAYKERKLALEKKERNRREKDAKRKAAKERRLHRQKPLKALVSPLESKWEDVVADAQYTKDFNKVLAKTQEGTELRLKDFTTLLGRRAWLNDEIINAYIEWVVIAANKVAAAESVELEEATTTVPKFIAHNSFFYENIKKKGPASTERLMKRKKAPTTSLLQVDTVFIPICQGSHWTIGIVRPIAKTIEYFDSMGGDPATFTRHMREWLKHQLGKAYVDSEWTEPRTACAYQTNGYDCGVFVCTNAFCVAFGLDTSCYAERDMIQQRRNIAAVLINKGFEGDFAWEKGGLV